MIPGLKGHRFHAFMKRQDFGTCIIAGGSGVCSRYPIIRAGGISVRFKLVLDGNAFYEIDEECLRKKEQAEEEKKEAFLETRRESGK